MAPPSESPDESLPPSWQDLVHIKEAHYSALAHNHFALGETAARGVHISLAGMIRDMRQQCNPAFILVGNVFKLYDAWRSDQGGRLFSLEVCLCTKCRPDLI